MEVWEKVKKIVVEYADGSTKKIVDKFEISQFSAALSSISAGELSELRKFLNEQGGNMG